MRPAWVAPPATAPALRAAASPGAVRAALAAARPPAPQIRDAFLAARNPAVAAELFAALVADPAADPPMLDSALRARPDAALAAARVLAACADPPRLAKLVRRVLPHQRPAVRAFLHARLLAPPPLQPLRADPPPVVLRTLVALLPRYPLATQADAAFLLAATTELVRAAPTSSILALALLDVAWSCGDAVFPEIGPHLLDLLAAFDAPVLARAHPVLVPVALAHLAGRVPEPTECLALIERCLPHLDDAALPLLVFPFASANAPVPAALWDRLAAAPCPRFPASVADMASFVSSKELSPGSLPARAAVAAAARSPDWPARIAADPALLRHFAAGTSPLSLVLLSGALVWACLAEDGPATAALVLARRVGELAPPDLAATLLPVLALLATAPSTPPAVAIDALQSMVSFARDQALADLVLAVARRVEPAQPLALRILHGLFVKSPTDKSLFANLALALDSCAVSRDRTTRVCAVSIVASICHEHPLMGAQLLPIASKLLHRGATAPPPQLYTALGALCEHGYLAFADVWPLVHPMVGDAASAGLARLLAASSGDHPAATARLWQMATAAHLPMAVRQAACSALASFPLDRNDADDADDSTDDRPAFDLQDVITVASEVPGAGRDLALRYFDNELSNNRRLVHAGMRANEKALQQLRKSSALPLPTDLAHRYHTCTQAGLRGALAGALLMHGPLDSVDWRSLVADVAPVDWLTRLWQAEGWAFWFRAECSAAHCAALWSTVREADDPNAAHNATVALAAASAALLPRDPERADRFFQIVTDLATGKHPEATVMIQSGAILGLGQAVLQGSVNDPEALNRLGTALLRVQQGAASRLVVFAVFVALGSISIALASLCKREFAAALDPLLKGVALADMAAIGAGVGLARYAQALLLLQEPVAAVGRIKERAMSHLRRAKTCGPVLAVLGTGLPLMDDEAKLVERAAAKDPVCQAVLRSEGIARPAKDLSAPGELYGQIGGASLQMSGSLFGSAGADGQGARPPSDAVCRMLAAQLERRDVRWARQAAWLVGALLKTGSVAPRVVQREQGALPANLDRFPADSVVRGLFDALSRGERTLLPVFAAAERVPDVQWTPILEAAMQRGALGDALRLAVRVGLEGLVSRICEASSPSVVLENFAGIAAMETLPAARVRALLVPRVWESASVGELCAAVSAAIGRCKRYRDKERMLVDLVPMLFEQLGEAPSSGDVDAFARCAMWLDTAALQRILDLSPAGVAVRCQLVELQKLGERDLVESRTACLQGRRRGLLRTMARALRDLASSQGRSRWIADAKDSAALCADPSDAHVLAGWLAVWWSGRGELTLLGDEDAAVVERLAAVLLGR